MATIDLGKIKLVWRGTYAGGTAYTVDDVVQHTDSGLTSSFICTTASTGNAPSTGGTVHGSWAYLAKGAVAYSSTLTTQGDVLYHTGSAEARLAKGTASQVLTMNSGATAPEWAAAAGGATAVVASGTISGSPSEIIHDGIFTSAYKFYELFIADLHSSSNANILLQMRNSNATVSTANYRSHSHHPHMSASGSYTNNNHNGWDDAFWEIHGNCVINAHIVSAMSGKILFPWGDNISTYNNILWNTFGQESSTTGQYNLAQGYGIYNGYQQYDGFRLYPSAGTFAEGEYTVIGYKS
tara:strand:- start:1749 stop:2636 length:888 start_codon:yes stop_codon:yes gene_type:complete